MLITVLGRAGSKTAPKATPKSARSTKSATTSRTSESRAILEHRLEIFERASANRELAALTQMEQMRELEKEALAIEEAGLTTAGSTAKTVYTKVGKAETAAAKLCGLAAANFDKAATNRKQVEVLSSRLNKSEKIRSARAYATNLKLQANDAIQQASIACEKAAVAYDKAHNPVAVAAASQQAAVWLEKLAIR